MEKKQLRGCLHTVIDDLTSSPLSRLRLIGFLVGLRSIEYEHLTLWLIETCRGRVSCVQVEKQDDAENIIMAPERMPAFVSHT